MEPLYHYLLDHIAGLSWLDYADAVILIVLTSYGLQRIDSKINPLIQQMEALPQTNSRQQGLLDSQAEELVDLRQQVQEMAYQHREVTELFNERNRFRDN